MRFKAFTGAAALTGIVALAACGNSAHNAQPSPQSTQMIRASAQAGLSPRTGAFAGLNDKHVSGKVRIADGQVVVSGFSSDAGPDLHIYLTNGVDESAVTAGKQLGGIAFDNASQNFPLGAVDASRYSTVVIHCDKAKAVFGSAVLA